MELIAPSRWHCVDFISDLHLQAAERPTFEAWAQYMRATTADAVFILGDLFEVWVGDDAALVPDSFEAECVAVLKEAGQRLSLFIMQGNRDFLMGPALMQACAATALPDPTTLEFAGQRWLLSHGDELCVDDVEYQVFRKQVRSAAWQQEFLAKPLAERQAIARGIRQASAANKGDPSTYADVDTAAALTWMNASNATHLVHGHTHKPAQHRLDDTRLRTVLSDWEVDATPPRAEVLRITTQMGASVQPLRLPAASIARTQG